MVTASCSADLIRGEDVPKNFVGWIYLAPAGCPIGDRCRKVFIFDIEQLLFEKRLNNELAVQTNIKLPETIKDFQNNYVKKYNSIEYRSDKAGYYFLRVLAHKYYETDLFPDFLGRTYCK